MDLNTPALSRAAARFYSIRIVGDRHVVGITTNGVDWLPLPRAAFGNPRDAIRYADMRQRDISPLRVAEDVAAHPAGAPSSATPSGASVLAGNPAGLSSTARSG